MEMVCDWRAAMERTKEINVKNSMDINQERFDLSDQMRQVIENTIKFLEGEKGYYRR